MNALDHALDYAARGLPVFPCKSSGANVKKPITAHGFKDASTDPEKIRAWWKQWPTALIGVAMGPTSGVFATDPDVPKEPGDADGLAAWNDLVARNGGILPTHAHETPSGGRHFLFAYPADRRITNREGALKGTGINVRGDGGYVIMAPSRLADGREYRLVDELSFCRFAPAPEWLLDLITADPERPPEPEPPPKNDRRSTGHDEIIRRYVAAAVDRECDLVARAPRGGRNNQLNTSAFNLGTLVGANVLSSHEATARLYAAAEAAGLVQADGKRSVMATIESGLTRGAEKPRDLSKVAARSRTRAREATAADPGDLNEDRSPGDNVGLVTEDEGAILFAERHRGKLRYCHDHGAWFDWTGAIWRKNGTGLAFHWARELARQMAENQDRKTETTARKAAFAGAVERFARADPIFAVTAETWDRDPWLLGTPGGTVDLRTGILRPARPEDGITKSTSVVPAPSADCPLFKTFLDDTFGGDAAMIAFAQRWSGYCLTGLTREHALVFGYGSGGNGKSVYVNVHVGIAGDYATTASMDVFISSNGDRHPTDLAMLRGARLVTASETEEGRQWAESRIKQLTGGDRISARFMRQDFFTFLPTFKLLIIGNHKPGLRNVDEAARRRFNLVPFTRKPLVPDRALEDKLKTEWPAILRWMIDGCLAWQRDGLAPPESVREATAAYFEEQDTFATWLDEECEVDPGNDYKTETSADLFAAWTRYAKAAGEAPMTRKAFGERMLRSGAQPHRGHGGVRMYKFIRLRPSARTANHAEAA